MDGTLYKDEDGEPELNGSPSLTNIMASRVFIHVLNRNIIRPVILSITCCNS